MKRSDGMIPKCVWWSFAIASAKDGSGVAHGLGRFDLGPQGVVDSLPVQTTELGVKALVADRLPDDLEPLDVRRRAAVSSAGLVAAWGGGSWRPAETAASRMSQATRVATLHVRRRAFMQNLAIMVGSGLQSCCLFSRESYWKGLARIRAFIVFSRDLDWPPIMANRSPQRRLPQAQARRPSTSAGAGS